MMHAKDTLEATGKVNRCAAVIICPQLGSQPEIVCFGGHFYKSGRQMMRYLEAGFKPEKLGLFAGF